MLIELEGMCKEASVLNLRYYQDSCVEGLKKATKVLLLVGVILKFGTDTC
jgi:hypothetical protein